jgi:hypothetical protein
MQHLLGKIRGRKGGSSSKNTAQKAREWWKTNEGSILVSAQFIFETVEKGLDGMPIPGPKAAFGAVARGINAARVRLCPIHAIHPFVLNCKKMLDENDTEIEDIAQHTENMNDETIKYTTIVASKFVATPSSTQVAQRLRRFTECVLSMTNEFVRSR